MSLVGVAARRAAVRAHSKIPVLLPFILRPSDSGTSCVEQGAGSRRMGWARPRCSHNASTSGASAAAAGLPTLGTAAKATHRGGLLARYQRCLETQPLLTKALSCALISAAGAVTADVAANPRSPNIDLRRAARFGLAGAFFTAPTCHVWWGLLGKWFGAGGFRCGLTKVTVDTLLWATPWQFGFIACVYVLEAAPVVGVPALQRLDLATQLESTLHRMPEIMLDYAKVWVPVQLVNFTFVPVPFQVLCVATTSATARPTISPTVSDRRTRGLAAF